MPAFRARARTVDLLGRQQIAGIPTAISELFKNAHDAYANRVEADFFRTSDLFVLRDDGVGMSRDDFIERWLTLGTESKVGDARGIAPPPRIGGEQRPTLGEKGIGRLAIASIGTQVVVLTRARHGRTLSDLTVALVNWRLFEIPGINLDDVDVPILELPGGTLPGEEHLLELKQLIEASMVSLGLSEVEAAPIHADLAFLEFDPAALLQHLGEPSLQGHGAGTQFLVVPTREQLAADIDTTPGTGETASTLVQTLIGFENTMTPDSPEPAIETAFRDWHDDQTSRDLIARDEFFTPEDFSAADHHVSGSFDDHGRFSGTVSVYGGKPELYEAEWPKGRGRELRSGPFSFELAYVQGDASQSRLDIATHGRLNQKLQRIGGLYIYRDGVRVLPYGTPGYDFLGIERRRTLNIGRYFFSYRRMFGVVELNRAENSTLQEKAGREGFQENGAYRDFRDVLQNLLIQLAADFFSTRGTRTTAFKEGREEAERRHRVRAEFERRGDRDRAAFAARVGEALIAIEEGRPQAEAAKTLGEVRDRVQELGDGADIDALAQLETEGADEIDAFRAQYRIPEPAGFGLDAELRRNWEWLGNQADDLEESVWLPGLQMIASAVNAAHPERSAPRRERLGSAIRRGAQTALDRVGDSAEQVRKTANEVVQVARGTADDSVAIITAVGEGAVKEIEAKPLEGVDDESFVSLRVEYEREIQTTADREELRLVELAARLRGAVGLNGSAMVGSSDELTAALDEELLYLREQADRNFELAQLGLATEVISHELALTLRGIRDSLGKLRAWADVNPSLATLQEELRGSFDHLDSYLALFTPLQRRTRRKAVEIKGFEIGEFIERLFARRLDEEKTELRITEAFKRWTHSGFRSTIYPVLINLVDNASYWVAQGRGARWIELDADDQGLTVTDSGPGVSERDRDAIWEFGFTRKPSGRGAGLHIAREVLGRDDWQIILAPREGRGGASFRIQPVQDGEMEAE